MTIEDRVSELERAYDAERDRSNRLADVVLDLVNKLEKNGDLDGVTEDASDVKALRDALTREKNSDDGKRRDRGEGPGRPR